MAASTFGRWEILQRLGAGGAGEVLLVSDGQQRFALKRLLPHLTDPASTASFDAEAALAARLHHRNVVRVIEYGQVRGTAFVVMEYVDGKSLHQLLGRCGRLSPTAAAWVVRELCRGLDYVHRLTDDDGRPLRLIHRDVSPANVLLSRDGQVKLCDFGIAKGSTTGRRTQPGLVKGKRGYLSPEQAAGNPLDARTDVYSAGIVFQEALGDEVPAELAHIASRAQAPLRDERFAGADQLAAALDAFLDGKDGQAELAACLQQWFPADIPVLLEPTRTLVRAGGPRRFIAGALLVLVAIVGVALLVYRHAPLPAPPPAPTIAPLPPSPPAPSIANPPARVAPSPPRPPAPARPTRPHAKPTPRPAPVAPRRDYMPDPFKR